MFHQKRLPKWTQKATPGEDHFANVAPVDPPRNQIYPKRSPDTKISQKSDSKTSTYHQKVVLKLKNHENIDPNSHSKRNSNPNSNSNQNPNSNPNPNQNPNPNPNPKQPDPPNPPNQPVTKILNPPIRYSANPGPAECAKRLNKTSPLGGATQRKWSVLAKASGN